MSDPVLSIRGLKRTYVTPAKSLTVLDGGAHGLEGAIKQDRQEGPMRLIELWAATGLVPAPGDRVRLTAGCDKRPATCRLKFQNFLNFRGFPHIPGQDAVLRYATKDGGHEGAVL